MVRTVSPAQSVHMDFSKPQKIMEDRGAWCATMHAVAKSQT